MLYFHSAEPGSRLRLDLPDALIQLLLLSVLKTRRHISYYILRQSSKFYASSGGTSLQSVS